MSETSLSPKRPRLDFDENSAKDEHFDKYKTRERERDQDDQNNYSHSHSKHRKRAEPSNPVEEDDGKDDEAKAKSGSAETARREHTLVMRLTNKEQELQDCMNQIQEMKQAQTQNTAQLRSMLLDPAINLVFQRMAKEMEDHKDKLKQKQNELTAWKFTPDSQTGMRVMARCRMLLEENQELGKMISSGRTSRLEGEIVLHKALATEMKKNQKELDEFVGELEEDVEGMQGMIFMLRQQLKEAQEQIARLQAENEQLRTLSIPPDPEPGGTSMANSGANTPLHTWGEGEHSCDNGSASWPHSGPEDAQGKMATSGSESIPKLSGSTPPTALSSAQALVPRSPLSATDAPTQDHLLTVAQPFEEFPSSGVFATKVTPDSGVHTQEEDEETSMDTTESTSAAAHTMPQQQSSLTCDQTNDVNSTPASKDLNSEVCLVPPLEQQTAASPTHSSEKPQAATTSPTPQDLSSSSNGPEDTSIRTKPLSAGDSTDCPSPHSISSTQTSSPGTKTSCHNNTAVGADDTTATSDSQTEVGTNVSAQESNVEPDSSDTTVRTNQRLPHQEEGEVVLDQTALSPENGKGEKGLVQDENKSDLHSSLHVVGVVNSKAEEEKTECQTTLGLVNGSANVHN